MDSHRIVCLDGFDSPLGPMTAGASDAGICFLGWQDRGGVDRIREHVSGRGHRPVEPGDHEHLKTLTRELREYFAGALRSFTVPLDISGTPFERAVWDLLLAIPYGATRSYGQIARALGTPGASRAVGRANGANRISIVIPCHRVIDSKGNLHGYGGGLWRKKRLLEIEGAL